LLKRARVFLVRLVVGGVTEEDGDWRSRICIFPSYVLIVIPSSQISGLFHFLATQENKKNKKA